MTLSVAALEYERRRGRRKRAVRARTLSARLPAIDLAVLCRQTEELLEGVAVARPATRADCQYAQRPCPFVSCRHHLFLDVTASGGVKLNFPDLEPHELRVSCALDVADQGGATLEVVAEHMNLTRERARQLENMALATFEAAAPRKEEW